MEYVCRSSAKSVERRPRKVCPKPKLSNCPQLPCLNLPQPKKNCFGIIFDGDYYYQQVYVEIKYVDGDLHIGYEPSQVNKRRLNAKESF